MAAVAAPDPLELHEGPLLVSDVPYDLRRISPLRRGSWYLSTWLVLLYHLGICEGVFVWCKLGQVGQNQYDRLVVCLFRPVNEAETARVQGSRYGRGPDQFVFRTCCLRCLQLDRQVSGGIVISGSFKDVILFPDGVPQPLPCGPCEGRTCTGGMADCVDNRAGKRGRDGDEWQLPETRLQRQAGLSLTTIIGSRSV